MKKSDKFYAKHRELKDAVIEAIQKALGDNQVEFDDPFDDEAHNEVVAVNKDNVIFDGDGEYPLDDLGMLDAIYILSIVESDGKRP